ncbi:MAG: phospholipid carrier-dependent glycosyltransferase, partial [Planctomycetaceae bacterium]|nr:phospholipid carrier-dependent glycosyltransferase [Planctomycetaceae bacterium]
ALRLLLGLTALLYCWNLGLVELSVTDEARSGMIVRDMVDGHWLLPRTPDGYLVEKPPAYYGPCAVLGGIFGVNEWTLRGVSVLAALGTLLVTAWIVRLFGSSRAAWLAAAALASNVLFLSTARDALVDMTLTFFLTLGFCGYFAGRLGRLSPARSVLVSGLGFGLAVLSKGPLGLALPLVVCGGEVLIETRGRFWTARGYWGPALGTVGVAVLIAALWYVPGLIVGKGEFLETSILSENFRMPVGKAAGIGVSHRKPWSYYGLRQAAGLLPMLPLLVALPAWLRDPASRDARRLLGCWAAFGFLLFQVAANKRIYYLVPLQPAFAAMIGLAADRWAERKDGPRWSFLGVGVALAAAGLACVALAFVRPSLSARHGAEIVQEIAVQRLWVAGFGLLFAAAGGGMVLASRGSPSRMLGSAVALSMLVVAGRNGVGDRFEARFNKSRPFVRDCAPQVPEIATVVLCPPVRGYSIDFYWPGRVVRSERAAQQADYVLVARAKAAKVQGRFDTLGVWKEGDEDQDVLLLRRRP